MSTARTEITEIIEIETCHEHVIYPVQLARDLSADGRGRLDHTGVVELLGVESSVEKQIGHADHAVHGGANLVAHVGQELTLSAVGGLFFTSCSARLRSVTSRNPRPRPSFFPFTVWGSECARILVHL